VSAGGGQSRGSAPDSLRVLHVYRTYFPDPQGGLQEAIRQICHATRARGVQNRVFTLSRTPDPPVIQREEAEVHRFPLHLEIASSGFSFTALRGFRRLVDWAHLVHYHFPWPFADLLHFAGLVIKPTVCTYHSDIIRQQGLLRLYRPLRHCFLGRMDRIVATSPNYLQSSAVLEDYAGKVDVIPIGLDETVYPQPADAVVDGLRARYGESFFLFVGVLRYYKGLHFLLEALRGTNLRALIVGTGPEEDHLKRRAAELRLENVQFLGHRSDEEKVALLRLSRAVVFPSFLRAEAFGVTLLEGAMQSKALICTEIGTGTTYVNKGGETGIVVPPADPIRLREAMQRLAADRVLAERQGQAARRRYEQLFTGSAMGERYLRLYEELLYR
jgi:glycosyltransferase involved in cell wall biosynthesis